MYWSWIHNNQSYISWGKPRRTEESLVINLKPRYDIPIYNGTPIKSEESIIFSMQGDSSLGLGDSIWLINFMRDIYSLKCRRRARFLFFSSPWVLKFYSNFLPSSFEMREEYITEQEFNTITYKLPAMYYWHDTNDNVDRSWIDNRSLVERLYNWTGMKYDGLLDWGDFTNEKILYPANDFWADLNLNKKDKYVYFQWHSSGHTKNINPRENIKIIKHIIKNYGYKVYVVGRLKCLDILNEIPGVVNLSGKTEGKAESLFTLAFNSEFIVTGDSAGLHLSEAYKIPSVCIMATLPPVYVASKYKIPSFMFGSGHCPYSPCGIVHHLPKETKCPKDVGDYCKVFDNIDLNLFDRCVKQSFKNRLNYRKEEPLNFYEALKSPISLEMV